MTPSSTSRATQPASAAPLSALDRQVVEIALRDTWLSVPSRDRVFRFVQQWLHGRKGQLANPRLETLRRYLVLYRQDRDIHDTEYEVRVLAAGYSEAQVRAAEALTDAASAGASARRGLWPVVRLAFCILSLGLMAAGLADWLDNLIIALIVIGAAVVTLLSFRASRPGVRR